ncbi:DUF1643 domain-containing protein [Pseudoduganella sp. GCM10020061]|uniref:DUF1643 domain-containing protein n=1 Tax=Pseudoduganella sp. GCM10020061 TaxID=3317345 RepID=UPI003645E120
MKRTTGARFSACGRYRYSLWRYWDTAAPYCLFLMLNPSTADEVRNDPTIERCERRARAMGFGGLHVANLFAWRSTDPRALLLADDPVGPGNDRAIVKAAKGAGRVICGWGNDGTLLGRDAQVLALLRRSNIEPYALAINKDGSPRHPLYVAYSEDPRPLQTD